VEPLHLGDVGAVAHLALGAQDDQPLGVGARRGLKGAPLGPQIERAEEDRSTKAGALGHVSLSRTRTSVTMPSRSVRTGSVPLTGHEVKQPVTVSGTCTTECGDDGQHGHREDDATARPVGQVGLEERQLGASVAGMVRRELLADE
jgi:hypothetical protein